MEDDKQEPIKATVVDEDGFSKEDLERIQKVIDKIRARYNDYKEW